MVLGLAALITGDDLPLRFTPLVAGALVRG